MTTELTGIVPITVTPFDAAGQVDEASIATLVEFEARCGVQGLNVLGIMGEAHKLSEGERRRVAEVFVKCEGQPGIGLALRKELLRLRGAIATSVVRQPGPALDDVTRQELADILARLGILEG
jgi:dihydrodipicolinate synthase/N-acetylneuraminate lyase